MATGIGTYVDYVSDSGVRHLDYVKSGVEYVYVEVLIPGNYKLGDGPKPSSPRLSIFRWFAEKRADWGRGLGVWTGKDGWMEKAVVEDFSGDLPDELFAIVNCSDHCSWWVHRVFVSEEKALAYVHEHDRDGEFHWVISANRCR